MQESKFNGDIKQDIKEKIKLYEMCARQYSLAERREESSLFTLLKGPLGASFLRIPITTYHAG